MTGKRVYQILLSALCILLAVMICSSAIGIYREGSRRKAEHPLETVYTKEAVEDAAAHAAPVFIAVVGMSAAGIALGIRDDRKRKTAAPGPTRHAENTVESKKQEEAAAAAAEDTAGKPSDRKRRILPAVLLAAALLCILAGICNGGMQDTFVKAANICTECIGLG